ncbi:MAG: hypothetical protein Q9220_004844 [cf. Caloplaca sp. 1 TL-2023]
MLAATSSQAVAIAFGNPAFAGISFGHPFHVSWFGGDGTPATIELLTGNPRAMQKVATLATGLTTSPYVWTPTASHSVRVGQLYVLSIIQSGLTNYSPVFGIAAAATQAKVVHAPLLGRYGNSSVFPGSEAMFMPAHMATGTIFPRSHATGTGFASTGMFPYATGTVSAGPSAGRAAAQTPSIGPSMILQEKSGGLKLNVSVLLATLVTVGCLLSLLWI